MNTEFDPYVELGNAIVEQAVEDYQTELAKLELDPKNGSAALEVRRLEKFFHSGWYGMLTDIDPDRLIEGIRILAKEKAGKKRIRQTQSHVKECLNKVYEILETLETQDELTEEQQEQVKKFCFEAVSLSEQIPQMKAEIKPYANEAARRMGLRLEA